MEEAAAPARSIRHESVARSIALVSQRKKIVCTTTGEIGAHAEVAAISEIAAVILRRYQQLVAKIAELRRFRRLEIAQMHVQKVCGVDGLTGKSGALAPDPADQVSVVAAVVYTWFQAQSHRSCGTMVFFQTMIKRCV